MIDFAKMALPKDWTERGGMISDIPQLPPLSQTQGINTIPGTVTTPGTITGGVEEPFVPPVTSDIVPIETPAGQTQTASSPTGGFNYPTQWDEASDFWSNMLTTGMPTSADDWWKAMQTKAGYDITKAGKQAAEEFGLGGMRYSTALGQQLGRIGSEATAGIMPQYWSMQMGAEEAARQRQMASAGNLFGIGGEYARLPLEVGERTLGMSGEYQRQQQQAMFPFMSEWQRMTPEQNPYLGMGMNFNYGQFGQTPVQYNQSPFGQFLNFGAQALPYLLNPAGAAIGDIAEGAWPEAWQQLR